MVQLAFTKRILAGAKKLGLHTAIETSAFSVTVLMSHIFQSWISFSSTSKARTLIRIAP
jgi:hypothetical protein